MDTALPKDAQTLREYVESFNQEVLMRMDAIKDLQQCDTGSTYKLYSTKELLDRCAHQLRVATTHHDACIRNDAFDKGKQYFNKAKEEYLCVLNPASARIPIDRSSYPSYADLEAALFSRRVYHPQGSFVKEVPQLTIMCYLN